MIFIFDELTAVEKKKIIYAAYDETGISPYYYDMDYPITSMMHRSLSGDRITLKFISSPIMSLSNAESNLVKNVFDIVKKGLDRNFLLDSAMKDVVISSSIGSDSSILFIEKGVNTSLDEIKNAFGQPILIGKTNKDGFTKDDTVKIKNVDDLSEFKKFIKDKSNIESINSVEEIIEKWEEENSKRIGSLSLNTVLSKEQAEVVFGIEDKSKNEKSKSLVEKASGLYWFNGNKKSTSDRQEPQLSSDTVLNREAAISAAA